MIISLNLKCNLNLDSQSPIILFIESELLTLESLFCYIGGIYGIWFGLSVYSIKLQFSTKHIFILIVSLNKLLISIIKLRKLIWIICCNIFSVLKRK
jgi:hypothetical protein